MNLALLGHPLGHSFSKSYFEEKFKQENINAQFINLDIDNLNNVRKAIAEIDNLKGFSVTIPYKKSIIELLDEIDNVALEIGAVNCVKIQDDGTWKGYNTDYIGFKKSLALNIKSRHSKALILGKGGAANAIAYALKNMQIPYSFVSRNDDGDYTYQEIKSEIISSYPIIINCTPLGMFPNIDTFPEIDYTAITENHLLYDLVYNPVETAFLKNGKEQGASIINGQKMLELQAEAAWKIWQEIN